MSEGHTSLSEAKSKGFTNSVNEPDRHSPKLSSDTANQKPVTAYEVTGWPGDDRITVEMTLSGTWAIYRNARIEPGEYQSPDEALAKLETEIQG